MKFPIIPIEIKRHTGRYSMRWEVRRLGGSWHYHMGEGLFKMLVRCLRFEIRFWRKKLKALRGEGKGE